MDFSFTGEQEMLRDSLRGFLSAHYRFEDRAAVIRSDAGWRPAIWRRLADLGVLGAALPERVGGMGGGATDTQVVMEELGAALVVEPYLECVVLAGGLLARAGGERADALAAAIVRGDALATLAWSEPGSRWSLGRVSTRARRDGSGWRLDGLKCTVIAAPLADVLLVSAMVAGEGIALFAVDSTSPGLRLVRYPTMDGRRAADVHFDAVSLPADALILEPARALAELELAADRGIAAIGAEALGVMRRLHGDTVDYARQRKQFGQAIGSFQALQHRMVDMYLQLEMATSASYLATLSLDAAPEARMRAVSAAKVTIAEACRFIGQNAVQLHGGVGMTEELPLGSYFKRATMIENEFGSVDYHLARHARLERAS